MKEDYVNGISNLEINKNIFLTPQFHFVSKDQIEEIYLSSLDVLENVGNKCYSEIALNYLEKYGCKINGNLVKVPSFLVEKAINNVPKRITIYNREGISAMEIQRRRSYYGNSPTAPFTLDIYTNERKSTTLKDVELNTRIIDKLPNIDFVMPPGTPMEVPAYMQDSYMLRATLLNTSKPIIHIPNNAQGVRDALEMAVAITGDKEAFYDKPFLISYPEPTSPLSVSKEAGDVIVESALLNLPMVYLSAPVLGVTAPMTPLGCLVQGMSELLFGLVIAQSVKPGIPFGFGLHAHGFNMHNGNTMMCDPSAYIVWLIFAQVSQYLKIYTFGLSGACDSKIVDGQASIEITLGTLFNALAGLNLIHDSGFLESCMTTCADVYVIANEVISYVKHFMKGIDFSKKGLAKEVIEKVGPNKSYLSEKHTLDTFREVLWESKLFDRGFVHSWNDEGRKTFEERVKEKVIQIAESYKPIPLGDDVIIKIDKIIKKSEALRKKV